MPTIQTLGGWIAAHGYRSAGYNREVYLAYGEGMPEPWQTDSRSRDHGRLIGRLDSAGVARTRGVRSTAQPAGQGGRGPPDVVHQLVVASRSTRSASNVTEIPATGCPSWSSTGTRPRPDPR